MFGLRHKAIDTDPEKIQGILTRGVEEVFIKDHLEAELRSGKRLRIKLGIDPTAKTIHIGRAVVLHKLRKLQELGHQIVLIVGDFTAQIGDASDKLEKRPMLSEEQVRKNLANYKKIIGNIIDVGDAEFVYNSSWLSKLTFKEICKLAETFTVQQMSSRRNFKDRLEKGEEISLREFLYPLMQGYDSVMVKADLELGGFDQLFNLKAGRSIQKHYGMPEQDILITQMLEGTDGRKMSSSWGNVITTTDEPSDMFGKIMSLRDDLILKYFLLCTEVAEREIAEIKERLAQGENPKNVKARLAREIVTLYHGAGAAAKAEADFTKTFSEGGVPENLPTITVQKETPLVEALLREHIIESKSEFRRLVEEGAVSFVESGEKVTDPNYRTITSGTFKIGKRRFLKITIRP